MDLDLRKLRYFTAVAEHEHFGRAAEQLYIAQPVLSRQIRALEQELGCALLERTTRRVELTPAGRQLLDDAPGVLAAADAATRRVHRAARGPARLVVGFAPGLSVSAAVRAFAATHPEVEVELLHLKWFEQAEAILDGRADVGLVRGDFSGADLSLVAIGTERKVACLPATHPLAARKRLGMADLEGELVLEADIRRAETVEEKFELVASGRGLLLVPRSVARYYAWPAIVHRPVTDGPVQQLWLATAGSRSTPHAADFVAAAVTALRGGPRR